MFFKEITFFSMSILLILILMDLSTIQVETKNCQNCTILLPRIHIFKNHILTRRKRIIVFPPKAAVLISQAFTKAIIDGRPPGLSYSIEFDMYSPTPDTLEGWQPTLLNNRIKYEKQHAEKEAEAAAAAAAAAAKVPTSKSVMDVTMMNDNFNIDDITYHDSHEFEYHDHGEHDFNFPNEIGIDPTMINSRFWSPFKNITRRRYNINHKQYHEMSKIYGKNLWKKPEKNYFKSKFYNRPSYLTEDIQNWPPFEEEVYESEEDVPIWKYHQAYRERRDLFQQMETLGKIFNFDMKACIQRAMCELHSSLRPYGESLMEDIVRIIFTIPKKLNFHDDYSFDFSQHEHEPNCAKIFKKNCPYRVLDFIISTLGTIKTGDIKYSGM